VISRVWTVIGMRIEVDCLDSDWDEDEVDCLDSD
jgi:hypothetical protein